MKIDICPLSTYILNSEVKRSNKRVKLDKINFCNELAGRCMVNHPLYDFCFWVFGKLRVGGKKNCFWKRDKKRYILCFFLKPSNKLSKIFKLKSCMTRLITTLIFLLNNYFVPFYPLIWAFHLTFKNVSAAGAIIYFHFSTNLLSLMPTVKNL